MKTGARRRVSYRTPHMCNHTKVVGRGKAILVRRPCVRRRYGYVKRGRGGDTVVDSKTRPGTRTVPRPTTPPPTATTILTRSDVSFRWPGFDVSAAAAVRSGMMFVPAAFFFPVLLESIVFLLSLFLLSTFTFRGRLVLRERIDRKRRVHHENNENDGARSRPGVRSYIIVNASGSTSLGCVVDVNAAASSKLRSLVAPFAVHVHANRHCERTHYGFHQWRRSAATWRFTLVFGFAPSRVR